jgi:hypothetical protein
MFAGKQLYCGLLWLVLTASVGASEPTVMFEINGNHFEGTPLSLTQDRAYMLLRDGKMLEFLPSQAQNFRTSPTAFTPTTLIDVRKELIREFGTRYEVTGAGHYLVVHPVGERNAWGARFEDLFRSFQHYFTARGFRPADPRFPLVAVILPKDEFQREAIKAGFASANGLMGFYSPKTNRVMMFDYAASNPGADWTINAETIIHEAAHQTAFNTGIHTRFADMPRWVTEGLGCLFEAKGVWNSRQYPQRADRINRYRLDSFKKLAARRPAGTLAEVVSNDRLFDHNIEAAYAEAWALTFFLSETEPRKWVEYLKKTAEKKAFEHYRAPERLQDFSTIFGPDLRMLETRYVRFVNELK